MDYASSLGSVKDGAADIICITGQLEVDLISSLFSCLYSHPHAETCNLNRVTKQQYLH